VKLEKGKFEYSILLRGGGGRRKALIYSWGGIDSFAGEKDASECKDLERGRGYPALPVKVRK